MKACTGSLHDAAAAAPGHPKRVVSSLVGRFKGTAPSQGREQQVAKDRGGDTWPVTIGAAAQRSGITAKMLRHYEGLGLLPGVARSGSGYRLYTQADVNSLQFIKRGRDLGFSMAEIAELLSLWHNRRRASASVKRIAKKHVDELSQRIAAMQAMQRTLSGLLHNCHGDERPDCPILDDLASATH